MWDKQQDENVEIYWSRFDSLMEIIEKKQIESFQEGDMDCKFDSKNAQSGKLNEISIE